MLRQRLVGALVLTALGVLFWPIIFVDQAVRTPAERLVIPTTEPFEPLPQRQLESFDWPQDIVDVDPDPQASIAEGEVEADARKTSAFLDGEVDIVVAEPSGNPREEAPATPDLDDKGLPIAYTLQVVSMASRNDADKVSQKLKSLNYKAYVVEVERPEGVRYRVYVGPKYEKAALAPVKRAVDEALSVDSMVVRYWP